MIITTSCLMTARRYPGYYTTTERNRDSHQSLFVKKICYVKASVSKHFSTCWGLGAKTHDRAQPDNPCYKITDKSSLLNLVALVQSYQLICSATIFSFIYRIFFYFLVKEVAYFLVDRSSSIPTLPNRPYQPIKAKHNQTR